MWEMSGRGRFDRYNGPEQSDFLLSAHRFKTIMHLMIRSRVLCCCTVISHCKMKEKKEKKKPKKFQCNTECLKFHAYIFVLSNGVQAFQVLYANIFNRLHPRECRFVCQLLTLIRTFSMSFRIHLFFM